MKKWDLVYWLLMEKDLTPSQRIELAWNQKTFNNVNDIVSKYSKSFDFLCNLEKKLWSDEEFLIEKLRDFDMDYFIRLLKKHQANPSIMTSLEVIYNALNNWKIPTITWYLNWIYYEDPELMFREAQKYLSDIFFIGISTVWRFKKRKNRIDYIDTIFWEIKVHDSDVQFVCVEWLEYGKTSIDIEPKFSVLDIVVSRCSSQIWLIIDGSCYNQLWRDKTHTIKLLKEDWTFEYASPDSIKMYDIYR